MSVRCLLADDHPALVAAVTDVLEEHGFEVVGPVADGAHAVAVAAAEQPELAVVDYRMPGVGGRELLGRLKEAAPELSVLVYTADAGEAVAQEALASGANGILLKEAPLADLLRALDALRGGRPYVDAALAAALVGAGRRADRPSLTDRERAVLRHVADGKQHDEIATTLGIGTETVRTHLRKACDRLGASTKTQAVATAIRLGLIE